MNAGTDYMLSVSLKYFPGISNLHFINNFENRKFSLLKRKANMNYERLYNMLCEKAYLRFKDFYKSSNLKIIKNSIYDNTNFKYLEAHHKTPKSDGGNNDPMNIVFFTPKEHIVAHHLLYKVNPSQAHAQAWHFQSYSSKSGEHIRLTAQQFDELRKINAENARNRIFETNRKMRENGRRFGCGNSAYGTKWYTNGIKNIRLKPSDEIPEGFYRGRLDVVPLEKHKSTKDMHWFNNGKMNKMFKSEDEIPPEFVKGMIQNARNKI